MTITDQIDAALADGPLTVFELCDRLKDMHGISRISDELFAPQDKGSPGAVIARTMGDRAIVVEYAGTLESAKIDVRSLVKTLRDAGKYRLAQAASRRYPCDRNVPKPRLCWEIKP